MQYHGIVKVKLKCFRISEEASIAFDSSKNIYSFLTVVFSTSQEWDVILNNTSLQVKQFVVPEITNPLGSSQ